MAVHAYNQTSTIIRADGSSSEGPAHRRKHFHVQQWKHDCQDLVDECAVGSHRLKPSCYCLLVALVLDAQLPAYGFSRQIPVVQDVITCFRRGAFVQGFDLQSVGARRDLRRRACLPKLQFATVGRSLTGVASRRIPLEQLEK